MTNKQCYSYSIVALYNLANDCIPVTPGSFYEELYFLWDRYSEEAIEKYCRHLHFEGKLDHFKIS